MRDEELDLILAQHFEPKPSVSPGELDSNSSPLGFWVSHEQIAGEWQPRNMVTDPAMTLLLMEKLHEEDSVIISLDRGKLEANRSGMSIDGLEGGCLYFTEGQTFGRAVAEAFARSKCLL